MLGILGTIFAVLAATILLVLSLQIPTVVENRTELANQKLGYPLHFVVQDNARFSVGEPDSAPFPYALNPVNPLHSPITVLALPLVLNYFVLYGSVLSRKPNPPFAFPCEAKELIEVVSRRDYATRTSQI